MRIKLKGGLPLVLVEGAESCIHCGQWFDVEEMTVDNGSYYCDRCCDEQSI